MNWKKLLGYVWAAPLTAAALVYVLLLTALGWYEWIGVRGDALVWKFRPKCSPGFMRRWWKGWGCHSLGNVIVTRVNPDGKLTASTMRHAQAHVNQQMRLGVFFPVLYGLSSLSLWLIGGHAYYDNPFEISARRRARQYIDLPGLFAKANRRPRRIYQHDGHAKGRRLG